MIKVVRGLSARVAFLREGERFLVWQDTTPEGTIE